MSDSSIATVSDAVASSLNKSDTRRPRVNLEALAATVGDYFGVECTSCKKLTDGGFHSIYTLTLDHKRTKSKLLHPVARLREKYNPKGPPVSEVVARVAFPAFQHDKMESEVATKLFLRANSNVPIPKIYFWVADANNEVGAEYMVMERVPGKSAEDMWDSFTFDQKSIFMEQLAADMSEVFRLRVEKIGSLYLQNTSLEGLQRVMEDNGKDRTNGEPLNFEIGRVVCTMYCSDPDDEFPRSKVRDPDRGPFNSAGAWLASLPTYELAYIEQHPDEAIDEGLFLGTPPNLSHSSSEGSSHGAIGVAKAILSSRSSEPSSMADNPGHLKERLSVAQSRLKSLISLANSYCGPAPDSQQGHLTTQFALLHHDFRLSNVQVDPATVRITGILDWEATHSAPLWACARMPGWIGETASAAAFEHGGERHENLIAIGDEEDTAPLRISNPNARRALPMANPDENAQLRDLFLRSVSAEWREAYEVGRDWRKFQEICTLYWMSWTEESMEERLALYRQQQEQNPGVPLEEEMLQKVMRVK